MQLVANVVDKNDIPYINNNDLNCMLKNNPAPHHNSERNFIDLEE